MSPTPAQRANLQAYLEKLRDLMRLQAWDIEVVQKPADAGSVLQITPDPRRHWAPVQVGTFFDVDADEQRQTCVHEIVHLVQADLWWWLMNGDWRLPLAPDVAREIEERVRVGLEVQADFLARFIAPAIAGVPEDWDA